MVTAAASTTQATAARVAPRQSPPLCCPANTIASGNAIPTDSEIVFAFTMFLASSFTTAHFHATRFTT